MTRNALLSSLFGFDAQRHNLRTEVLAGITTFLTMAYILAVNPSVFSALSSQGMPTESVFTATVLAAVVGTLVMAVYAKKPFGLAPGMGLNAFFVYTVCLGMGYDWRFALTAVLIEGIIFILLTITNVREAIVNTIPLALKRAIGAGIGLYIAFIGLKSAGIVVSSEATSVTLGNLGTTSSLLAIFCFIITSVMIIRKIRGGLLFGILLTTIIGIPFGVTQFGGVVDTPPSVAPILCQFEWGKILSWDMLVVVVTFLFIDMFDTIGTVVGVSVRANMVDKNGRVDGISRMLMADAVATVAGACVGASTTTTYIESAAGVAEGGRTGVTSFVVALLFGVALFFAPLFLAIPACATGPVLVIVGVMMALPIKDIDWGQYSESIPAFTTMFLMPLCYSISDGIMLGMVTYTVLNAITGGIRKISPVLWILTVLFILRYVFM